MIKRPPDNLGALNDAYLFYWLKSTERDLNDELERICRSDPRFRRVLADALRVEDECKRRAGEPIEPI